ncbi:MAG TPA: beta-galactosidase [Candidatus Hydrogenedentes bacterium]|nr:beta-galactosidase [Candidatus Hydrogenedentota bacterium]HOS02094.1 beta-galactosidase [Candidatus Hydrogenedentota bacterium]
MNGATEQCRPFRKAIGTAFLVVIACVAGTAQETPRNPWDVFARVRPVSLQGATPWAKPLAGGPIRALCIAPRAALRDAYALAERMDMRLDCAPLWDAAHLGCDGLVPEGAFPGASEQETLATLRGFLRRSYDVILAGNFSFSLLPEDVQVRLIEEVDGGAGLLLAYHREGLPETLRGFLEGLAPDESGTLAARGVGEAATPEWAQGLLFLTCGKAGKGRVAQLEYGGERPATHFALPPLSQPTLAEWTHYETYLGMAARTVLWAAGRDPSARIARIEAVAPAGPSEEEAPPDLFPEFVERSREMYLRLPGRQFVVHLEKPAARTYSLRVQLRTPGADWVTTFQPKTALHKGRDSYLLNLPIGPGQHVLDVWLLDGDKVVTWHSEPEQVRGWPEIDRLLLSKGALLPNDTLDISVAVSEAAYAQQPCTVYARGTDPYGRLVAETMVGVPREGGSVAATLEFADLLAPRVKVEAFALARPPSEFTGRPSNWELQNASFAYVYMPVRQTRPADAFAFVAQGMTCDEFNQRSAMAALAAAGVDFVATPATDAAAVWPLETGLRPLPLLTRYAEYRVEDGGVRVPCLSDPLFRDSEARRIRDRLAPFRVAGQSLYSLGDGNCVSAAEEDLCHAPATLDGFRAYLAGVYGDLGAINAAWKASFASWDDVVPSPRETAAARESYASWIDFRRYMDVVLTGIHTFGRDVVLGADREARTGFTPRLVAGATAASPYGGYDFWHLASQMGLMALPPGSIPAARLRCYAPLEALSGVCGNASPDDLARGAWLPWHAAINGLRSFWWDACLSESSAAATGPALGPGGEPTAAFTAAAASTAAINSGIGAVLFRAKRLPAAIALYDSQASRYLDAIAPAFGSHDVALAAYARLLDDVGVAYDLVSYDQATQGGLAPYKAVALPLTRALSDAEADALRAFHASGGMVIADIAPGQFDDHGVPRAAPALAELFGVRYDAPPTQSQATEGAVIINANSHAETTLPGVVFDRAVAAAGASPLGKADGTPLWLERKEGTTYALLTNVAMTAYGESGGKQRDLAWRTAWNALLSRLLPQPPIGIETQPDRVFHGDSAAFTYGKARIVVAVRRPEGKKPEKARLRFDEKTRVHDMLTDAPPARRKNVARTLAPGQAAVFAALPYDVTKLVMAAPKAVGQGKRIPLAFEVVAHNAEPGEHCVHTTLSRINGDALGHYSRTTICPGGKGQTYIPLARNETPGLYRLRARDVLSGMTAETVISVLPTEGR